RVLRFANRVPLLYMGGACAMIKAMTGVNWKSYGLAQPRDAVPLGPVVILIHIASVWVPFTNEAKEAIASYDEIVNEIRLALMECGRKLGAYVNSQQAEKWQRERKSLFEKYIEEVATAISEITKLPREKVRLQFLEVLPKFIKLDAPVAPPDDAAAPAGAPSIPPPPGSDPPPPLAEVLEEEPARVIPAVAMKQPALPGLGDPKPAKGKDTGTSASPAAKPAKKTPTPRGHRQVT
ncbi:MAG: hypothetical protein WCJ30_24215, partial [Deltaproteobacteria bacterium]